MPMCLRQNLQRHPAKNRVAIYSEMGGELFTYSWEPRSSRKNSGSHIDASLSRQPLVKGERLVRYEVNAVIDNASIVFFVCVPQRKKRPRANVHGHFVCACDDQYPSRAGTPKILLPQRVRCNQLCAMPMQRARVLEQARRSASPQKN